MSPYSQRVQRIQFKGIFRNRLPRPNGTCDDMRALQGMYMPGNAVWERSFVMCSERKAWQDGRGARVGSGEPAGAVLEVSDNGQMAELHKLLELDARVRVSRTPRTPGPGRQGALDVLTVVAGSGGLVAALRVLPEFIRSRRSHVSITVTVRDKQVTLEADNLPEAMALLEKLLDD